MPAYDFRCKNCQTEFTAHYKSMKAYDEATTTCPNCQSDQLARIIRRVSISGAKQHDYTKMNSNEMLSVFESGDSKAVQDMVNQVGGVDPASALPHHNQAQSLDKPTKSDDAT